MTPEAKLDYSPKRQLEIPQGEVIKHFIDSLNKERTTVIIAISGKGQFIRWIGEGRVEEGGQEESWPVDLSDVINPVFLAESGLTGCLEFGRDGRTIWLVKKGRIVFVQNEKPGRQNNTLQNEHP